MHRGSGKVTLGKGKGIVDRYGGTSSSNCLEDAKSLQYAEDGKFIIKFMYH